MTARDAAHYVEVFGRADTVGVELVAVAIHAAHRLEGRPPAALILALRRQHGDEIEGDAAAMMVASAVDMTPTREGFGARLAAAREAAGYTTAVLAALAQVSGRSIRYYEEGGRVPDVLAALRLAHALGTTIKELTTQTVCRDDSADSTPHTGKMK
jgi:DNA-binding XRE family transcriptional regulator